MLMSSRVTAGRSRPLQLAPLLLALAVNQVYAGPTGLAGTPGTNGTTPGAPGTAGSAGSNVLFTQELAGAPFPATDSTTGGNGGTGGNGANGGAEQRGGAAGAGGAGGSAGLELALRLAPQRGPINYAVTGGNGGNAGTPGTGGTGTGAAAAGGAGGASRINAQVEGGNHTDSLPGLQLQAIGGNGGNGTNAGAGGAAALQLHLAGASATELGAFGRATGGNGGSAIDSGNGGAGGDASGIATAANAGTQAGPIRLGTHVYGGAGGAAAGSGSSGGRGGSASGSLRGDTGNSDTNSSLWLIAGNGGAGRGGASAAAGGNVTVRDPLAVTTTGNLALSLSTVAGAGGTGYGTSGGRGGNVDTSLTLEDRQAASVNVAIGASGGNGGSVEGAGQAAGSGGNARANGNVTSRSALVLDLGVQGGSGQYQPPGARTQGGAGGVAHADGRGSSTASTSNLLVRVYGGEGGGARGAARRGGDGGVASGSAATFGIGTAKADLRVWGGKGGNGWDGADGGAGAAVALVNAVSGSTEGTLTLDQYASGGNGGHSYNGGRAGSGGAAVSNLTIVDTAASVVHVSSTASAGSAGENSGGSTFGSGGNAESNLVLRAERAGAVADGTAVASGGGWQGNRVDSVQLAGNSVVRSTVQADRSATSTARGYGGSLLYQRPAFAGTTDVLARAVANGAATARASSDNSRLSKVRAEAEGGTGPTLAFASALTERAQVSAYSSARGSAVNTAEATSRAQNGTIDAVSTSNADGGQRVTTSVSITHRSQIDASARTSANVGGALPVLPADLQANDRYATVRSFTTAQASASPDSAAISAVLAMAPTVAAALDGSQIVGAGAFTGGMYLSGSGPRNAYSSVASANFRFDTTVRGLLTLGLIDTGAYGSGFGAFNLSISNGETELFQQSFSNLSAAQAFFNDHALSLGELAAGTHELLLTAGFTITTPQAFGFTYALGVSPVPEPQTWLMLLGGTVVLLRQRSRRRRPHG